MALEDRFSWGQKIEDIVVGPYTIRAYHPLNCEGGNARKGINQEKINYHGYIDGEDTNEGWLTLDEALAGLIVRRTIGFGNTRIGEHFVAGLKAMVEQA